MKQRVHIHDELQSELVLIGAPDLSLLIPEVDAIVNYIGKTPNPVLRDIAYTTGLNAMNEIVKGAVVATSTEDLLDKLALLRKRLESGKNNAIFSKGIYIGTTQCPAPGRTVFLFPGEGSQFPDMLRDISLNFPACRSAFDDADTACSLAGAERVPSQWIFPTGEMPEKGIAEEMGMAAAIQAVIAADTGLLRLITQLGITPDAVAGTGIGEIVAMEAARAIEYKSRSERHTALASGYKLLSTVLDDVTKQIPPCASLSVAGLQHDKLEAIVAKFDGSVIITRDQTSELHSVCVKREVVDAFSAKLIEAGATLRTLSISKPFHTPWIKPFIPALNDFFKTIITKPPEIPTYSFMTADVYNGTPAEIATLAAAQWENPIRMKDTIEHLYDDGFRVFVEIGAKGTLSTCVSSLLRHKPHMALAINRGHRPDIMQLNHTLAALAAHGQQIDIRQLHAMRNSKLLDMAHPGITHAQRQIKTIPLNTKLPSMSKITIPDSLAEQASNVTKATPVASAPHTDVDTGHTDFPMISDGEILRYAPEDNIDIVLTVSIFEFPFLADAALSGSGTSLSNKSLHGMLILPVEVLLEIMAETARKTFPKSIVTGVENLSTIGWPLLDSQLSIRIQARRLPKNEIGIERIETVIYDTNSFTSEKPVKLASAIVLLAEEFASAPIPTTLALRNPAHVDWQGTELYPERLPSGPAFQNILAVPEWGDNGLRAECVVLPRNSIIRKSRGPRFSTDPVMLSSLGAALAAWHSREPANGNLQIAYACDKLEFFSPALSEWTKCEVDVFANPIKAGDMFATANAEISDTTNRLLIKATGWKNRVIRIRPQLHHLLLHPADGFFTTEIPRNMMPSLPQEVVCCSAQVIPGEIDDTDADIRMKLTASLTLSATELIKWNELGGNPVRRTEWLFGRLAAKDAVRRCLLARYARRWAAADIRIESDEAGKPSPQGEWRKLCGARMDISITHTTKRIVAAAAPNASLGIDIENRGRTISEEFISDAFTPLEQEIAADSGDGATALFRFWCAKEALSKALGTGLRYGAGNLCAHSIDPTTGKIVMEATKLWLQPFPQLRGKTIDVQSCLINDMILAVCVLDPSISKPDQNHFIRWDS